jgi:hypothetical protein
VDQEKRQRANKPNAKQQAERRAHLLSLSASKERNQQAVNEESTSVKKNEVPGSLVRMKKRKRKAEAKDMKRMKNDRMIQIEALMH